VGTVVRPEAILASSSAVSLYRRPWDLMAFQGANGIVSPMISTAHFAILPEASRHWMISPRGKDDTTVTG
jgi:quinol-cytochrome oxidoreductase complex cytochrome b subunit